MRFQFEPRGGFDHVVRKSAIGFCRDLGATHIRESFPVMYHLDMHNRPTGGTWRGTNQPRTISFSAPNNEIARIIAEAYGTDAAMVWNITERHYV